jgi:hypothetical protein
MQSGQRTLEIDPNHPLITALKDKVGLLERGGMGANVGKVMVGPSWGMVCHQSQVGELRDQP